MPVRSLLWRDMLAVGTAINLLATFAALMLASQGAPAWWAVALHFAPLPYNLFLVAAIRRTAPSASISWAVALVWLVVMTVV